MKRRLKKQLLFTIVVFLFVFSLYKTCDLLGVSFRHNNSQSEQEEKTNKNNTDNIKQHYNNNIFQTEEIGQFLYDDTYIYFNTDKYLIKRNKDSGDETPISTPIKNLIDADNYIYGTSTYANGNDILMDYVIGISKDGDEKEIFYKTESSYITSVVYDGQYIYYTNESHNIYRLNVLTKESEILKKDDKKADYPFLIGIIDSKIYYINGMSISYYDIIEDSIEIVSYEGCSIYQKPIIYKNYIYMYGNLNNDNIIRINLETGTLDTILDTNYIKNKTGFSKINNFNIIDDYLFININKNIYYINIKDSFGMEFYKNIPSESMAITDDSFFYLNNEKIEEVYINWLISK